MDQILAQFEKRAIEAELLIEQLTQKLETLEKLISNKNLLISEQEQPNRNSALTNEIERTFIMIKPDGIQRNLVGTIIKALESKGYKIVGMKFIQIDSNFAEKHYADLSSKPFFHGLIQYIISGPVLSMAIEGKGVVKMGRTLIGATNPSNAETGSFRGKYSIDVGRNIIHASDSVESANKEIALWFNKNELIDWKQETNLWINE